MGDVEDANMVDTDMDIVNRWRVEIGLNWPVNKHEHPCMRLAHGVCKALRPTTASDCANFHLRLPEVGMACSTCAP